MDTLEVDQELRAEAEVEPRMRDVLMWAGTALMWGQMLEASLATFRTLEGGHAPAETSRFRNLLRGAEPRGTVRPQPGPRSGRHLILANDLERVIRRRDFVMDGYFRSTNCQHRMKSETGRRALVEDLRSIADECKGWADGLAPVLLAYAVTRGRTTRTHLMRRVTAMAGAGDPQESELAIQARAALEMEPEGVEQMVQVLRELDARRR